MFIQSIPVGIFRCNCTVLACESTGKAVVVDPGDAPDRILEVIRRHDLDVLFAIHTHAHLDHVMGTFGIVEATGATARLHEGDYRLWHQIDKVADSYCIPTPRMPVLGAPLMDGETIRFGDARLHVIHTPGHTAGSCCFHLSLDTPLLLSGDTLFHGKIGIACPPYRSPNTIIRSIRDRLFALDDHTRVIPGHGAETAIGIERRSNEFLALSTTH